MNATTSEERSASSAADCRSKGIGHATQNEFANNGEIGPPDANAAQRRHADADGAGGNQTVDSVGHSRMRFAGLGEFVERLVAAYN